MIGLNPPLTNPMRSFKTFIENCPKKLKKFRNSLFKNCALLTKTSLVAEKKRDCWITVLFGNWRQNKTMIFFEIIHKKPEKKTTATILIDQSGSMASVEDARQLQQLAFLLSSGLSAAQVQHEILGFSAPIEPLLQEHNIPNTFNRRACRLQTNIFKSFKEKSLTGLDGLKIEQAENSDGESVRIAIQRLKKQTGQQKFIFLISDGKPYMQDSDIAVLDDDLRSAVSLAAQEKIILISIGFKNNHAVLGEQHLCLHHLKDLTHKLKDIF